MSFDWKTWPAPRAAVLDAAIEVEVDRDSVSVSLIRRFPRLFHCADVLSKPLLDALRRVKIDSHSGFYESDQLRIDSRGLLLDEFASRSDPTVGSVHIYRLYSSAKSYLNVTV
jgi:hypothetical protein